MQNDLKNHLPRSFNSFTDADVDGEPSGKQTGDQFKANPTDDVNTTRHIQNATAENKNKTNWERFRNRSGLKLPPIFVRWVGAL